MKEGLHLTAKDDADLTLIAACLQDALVPLSETYFDAKERRFYMIANRFRWEKVPEKSIPQSMEDVSFSEVGESSQDQRRNVAIRIDNVMAARSRAIDLTRPEKFLSLLTLQRNGNHLEFIFSGGGIIQLEIETLALILSDLGHSWPALARPFHDRSQESSQ